MPRNERPAPAGHGTPGWSHADVEVASPAVLAYEARRCQTCGAKYPAFGFGSPLTHPGQELWACTVHRADLEHLLCKDRN